jgi:hypothetical protein
MLEFSFVCFAGLIGYLFGLFHCYQWSRNVIEAQEKAIEDLTQSNFRH